MDVITDTNFKEKTITGITVIYCWHETCVPCKSMGPLVEKLEHDFEGLNFAKLNVHDYPQLQLKFQVRGVPQLLVFANGEFKGRIMHQNEKQLRASFERLIKNNGKTTKFDLPEALKQQNLFGDP